MDVRRGSSANRSSFLRLKYLVAVDVLISRFHECLLTALGRITKGCEASSASPNFCWFGLTAPGFNQCGLGTSDGRTTSMDTAAMLISSSLCGTLSSTLKPLCTATSRMVVDGSNEA